MEHVGWWGSSQKVMRAEGQRLGGCQWPLYPGWGREFVLLAKGICTSINSATTKYIYHP